jgi:hypothetical protein
VAAEAVRFSISDDQIGRLLLRGNTKKEIAASLPISETTVKNYMTNAILFDLRFELWRGGTATGLHYIDLACPSSPDALVNEAESSHILGSINIAQIDDDRLRHFTLHTLQI